MRLVRRVSNKVRVLTHRVSPRVMSPGRPVVKVVGIFRSGTNLAKVVLEQHCQVRVLYSEWGWKHGLPLPPLAGKRQLAPPVPVVVMVKDPVQANLSLYRFWRKTRPDFVAGRSFAEFIRDRFVINDNTLPDMPNYTFPTPTDYWNQFYFAYLNWGAIRDRLHVIRFEDLIADPDRSVRATARACGLGLRGPGPIALPPQEVLPSTGKRAARTGRSYSRHDGAVDPDDLRHIWRQVHPDVASALGYAPPDGMPAAAGPGTAP